MPLYNGLRDCISLFTYEESAWRMRVSELMCCYRGGCSLELGRFSWGLQIGWLQRSARVKVSRLSIFLWSSGCNDVNYDFWRTWLVGSVAGCGNLDVMEGLRVSTVAPWKWEIDSYAHPMSIGLSFSCRNWTSICKLRYYLPSYHINSNFTTWRYAATAIVYWFIQLEIRRCDVLMSVQALLRVYGTG